MYVYYRQVARNLALPDHMEPSSGEAAEEAIVNPSSESAGLVEQLTEEEDEPYFSSYAHFSIHTEMLQVRKSMNVL